MIVESGNSDHARALALLEQGDGAEAYRVLREEARRTIDPELLNDLAVLAINAGDRAHAGDLLRMLVSLYPEHSVAAENLAEAGADERRASFLQVVADALGTHLADNIDYLFDPYGRELPDPATVGGRLAEQLEILDRCSTFWDAIGDEPSRELFLRFLAYRALGPEHVRLQLEPREYRPTVIGLSAKALRRASGDLAGLPLEFQHHEYDLHPLGVPIRVIGPPLPIASTMAFSQYAYRDEAAAARPRPGDVVLDVGGCWGETALWLAFAVGEQGRVHTVEPAPGNLSVLRRNLDLNPELASRITVWVDPVGPENATPVWLPDVVGAGVVMRSDPSPVHEDVRMIELRTRTIDGLVEEEGIPRVDFIKVDVEGADLGVLRGAAETIRSQRPRMAIACYHKPDDLVTIPDFVASLGVDYRWYLQCSTMTDIDTVAFAVPSGT